MSQLIVSIFAFLNQYLIMFSQSMRKMCLSSELFWSAVSRIWAEYREIRSISPYSVRMREIADQNNSEYGHFVRIKYLFCRSKCVGLPHIDYIVIH